MNWMYIAVFVSKKYRTLNKSEKTDKERKTLRVIHQLSVRVLLHVYFAPDMEDYFISRNSETRSKRKASVYLFFSMVFYIFFKL